MENYMTEQVLLVQCERLEEGPFVALLISLSEFDLEALDKALGVYDRRFGVLCTDMLEKNFGASTLKILDAWRAFLDECTEGELLVSIEQLKEDIKNAISVYNALVTKTVLEFAEYIYILRFGNEVDACA